MQRLLLQTPSRLHFGLLSWGDAAPRRFGGVGLMVRRPGLTLVAEPAAAWSAEGPLAGRARTIVGRVAEQLAARGVEVAPLRLAITAAPPEHVGLGVGTQLGMAVARAVTEFAGLPDLAAADLAGLAGRGLRSGIGLHGFGLGGLIVDGGRGRGDEAPVAPLLARLDWPTAWSVLVAIPPASTGLHGPPEARAFGQIPPLPDPTVDRLCRLVLLDLLPAVAERDLVAFGAALGEIQLRVGQGFAPAQGGVFASLAGADLAAFLAAEGLHGVGQSSWGPTLYGFSTGTTAERAAILARVEARTGWPVGSAFWTEASPRGVEVERS